MTGDIIQLRPSEKEFQAAVIQYAEHLGWQVAHFNDSRRQIAPGVHVGDRQAAGFPDLVLVRNGRLIFAELKSDTGRVRPGQQRWLTALGRVEDAAPGVVLVGVWTPASWPSIRLILGAS